MAKHYKNVEHGSLFEYITPDKFRTISAAQRDVPLGITEIAVEIQLNKRMRDKISFKIPWDGVVYGCARDKRDMKAKLGIENDIKTAYIIDWDDEFLLLFELEGNIDRPVLYISSLDVIKLLENCWRIPEQR